jgi:ABC-type branched-subunit amino acid transport system ATPase component
MSILGDVSVTPEDRVHLVVSWPVQGSRSMFCSLTVQEALEAAIAIVNDEDDDFRVQPKVAVDADAKPLQ